MNPSLGSGSSDAVTARPADLRARKYRESGLRPNPVGGEGMTGVLEITEGQKHGVRLYDAEDPPRELELVEWPSPWV